jgi:hypothetical protein
MHPASRGFIAQLIALLLLAAAVGAGTALLISAVLFLLAPR